MVVRSVACRSSASRVPLSRSSRCPRRSSSASGASSFVRAAASSIARGSRSRRVQIAATALERSTSGRTARARVTKSSIASSSASGGRSNSRSPWMRSASRLVTKRRSVGAAKARSATMRAACGRRCSTLSRTTWVRRPCSADAIALVLGSVRSQDLGDGGHDQRRHRGPAPAGRTPCPHRASSASRRASSIAKRVLPAPPGPTMVSTRGSSS